MALFPGVCQSMHVCSCYVAAFQKTSLKGKDEKM